VLFEPFCPVDIVLLFIVFHCFICIIVSVVYLCRQINLYGMRVSRSGEAELLLTAIHWLLCHYHKLSDLHKCKRNVK